MSRNWDTFKQEMVEKIDNGTEMTEQELRWFTDYSINDIEGDEHRWTMDTKSIIEHEGRLFAIDWDRGLTESQENMFYNQPYEVEKITEVKTIEVARYEKLK